MSRHLAPVTQLIDLHQMVVAHPSVPANTNTMRELVELARSRPGALNYGSYGNGSQPQLLFEALKKQTGIQIVGVPGHFQTGRLKPLAIARNDRLSLYPDVPTLREAGFPDIDPRPWFGLFAPSATPRPVVARIRQRNNGS